MIDQDIKIFVLKTLQAADGQPMSSETLVSAVANRFSHVALTMADIRQVIQSSEAQGLISGTNDEVLGVMWALTPKGKIKAQQLK